MAYNNNYGSSGGGGYDKYNDNSSFRPNPNQSNYGGPSSRPGAGYGSSNNTFAGPNKTGGSYGGPASGLGNGLKTIQWDLSALPVFEKNFYLEHPAVTKRDESFSEKWRAQNQISIIGRGVPKPVLTFEEASMPAYVLKEVLKQGFDKRKIVLI